MNMSIKPIEQLLKDLKSDTTHVPSDVFRKNAKIRILNSLTAAQIQKKPSSNKSMWFFLPFRMFALSFVMLCVILLVSQSSKPTNILFPVKVMSERVALTLSPNEKAKSAVVNTIISRRTSEVESAKKSGSTEAIEKAIQVLEKTTEELRQSPKNDLKEDEKEDDSEEDDREEADRDSSEVKGSSTNSIQSPSPTTTNKSSDDNSKVEDKEDEVKRRSSSPEPSEKPEQNDSETHDDDDDEDEKDN